MPEEIHNTAGHSLGDPTRLIQLTDGVFAIIMTLLVLEVKVPEVHDGGELEGRLSSILYLLFLYAISFLLAGVYWMSHRMLFSTVKHINHALAWINIVFLMICSLIPFGAALLGRYPHETLALVVYGTLLALLAGYRLYMYVYITSHHELLHAPVPERRRRKVLNVMIFAPVMFLLSIAFCPYFPTFALILYAVTPPIFVTAIWLVNRTPAHA